MPARHQYHHSPTQTAARLTFRRAPSFSSPVEPFTSTTSHDTTCGGGGGSNGKRSSGGTGTGTLSSLSPLATLRGLLSGGTPPAPSTARHTQRPMRVGFADEGDEEGEWRSGHNDCGDDDIIPVKMTLGRFNGAAGGRTRMVFTDQGWQVDDDLRRAYERRIHELTEELAEAEHAALASQSECKRLKGEKEDQGVLRFKNRLLVDMLAIAQLDEAAAREALGRERTKSEEYRKELERCYARMLGFGIDPGIPSSETPRTPGGTMGARSPTKRKA